MSCDIIVKASNGNPSIAFNSIKKLTNNVEKAHTLYIQLSKPNFKEWFNGASNTDVNGEPIIDNMGLINNGKEQKSVFNFGTFGKQNTEKDVISYLQSASVVTKKSHLGSYWVRKGDGSSDGTYTSLLERNIAKLDTFNKVYLREYGQPLVYTHKSGTSYKVSVNNTLLELLNNRNNDSVYYSNVVEEVGDMDANAMQIMSNTLKNFTVEEESYGINIVSGFIIKLSDKISKLTMKDAMEGNTVRNTIAKVIKHTSQKRYNDGLISQSEHEVNIKIANEILDETSLFWTKIKSEVRTNSGFIINELEEVEQNEDTLNNSFDENLQFIVDPHERVSNQIKDLINTTVILDSKNFEVVNGKKVHHASRKTPGGFTKTMRFLEVSGYLVQNISTTNSVEDMIKKLEDISKYYNPSFSNIVTALKNDKILAADFFTSFKNESPNRIITLLNPNAKQEKDKVQTQIRNRSSFVRYQIADNWINTLQMYKFSDFYNQTGSIKQIENKYKVLYGNVKNRAKGDARINTVVSYFNLVGINIDQHIVRSILEHPDYTLNEEGKEKDTDTILDEVFGLVIQDIHKYITYTGDINKIQDVKILGNILNLAVKLDLFYNPTTSAYINITGNQEQTFNKPTFLGDWFNMMEDDTKFLEHLINMVKDPRTRHSNWLITTANNEGFLKLPKEISPSDVMNNLDKLTLNKSFYENGNLSYEFYDGITHKSTSQSLRYSDIVDGDWNYLNVVNYFNREKQARYSLISPADRGNSRFIKAPKFRTKSSDYDSKNNLSRSTKLYNAVYNIFVGETNRISKEYDYLFDENGEVKRELNELYVNYHYKLDDNNKPIFKDKNDNPVGDAFKYHYFDYTGADGNTRSMNSIFKDDNGIPYTPDISILNDKELMKVVHINISNMIASMSNEQIRLNKNNTKVLDNIISPYKLTFKQAMVEYTTNRFIANAEMINMFMGDVAFYGNADKANKRATELLASGVVNNSYGTKDTFNGVTIHNRIITNNSFLNNMKTTLESQNVEPDVIKFIVDSYKGIDSGDAQSYVTWDEYVNRLKKFGIYNKYKHLIDKIEDENANITAEELNEFANAFKNFYYGYEFDGMRMVPNQVKNSEQPLIPRFIKGTELEALYNEMKKQDIVQVNFASAEKVGSGYIADITTEDGSLKLNKVNSELKLANKKYYYKNLRKQQDIVNHSIDTTNKLGVQIAKKIIDNVADETKIQELFGLYVSNIETSADELLEDLGITRNDTGEYTVNKEKLSEILLDASIDRGVVNNILQGLALDETGEFKIPLDHSTTRTKNQAMITSLFTNRVVNQRFNGIHGPQMSNAFMRKIKDGKVSTSDDLSFTQFTSKDGKSGYRKAQIKLPAWSKKFFNESGDITIEQLKEAGLDTMVGYRIPTEDKHSMVVFEVVEFLDSSMGSTMVVPTEFVPQTGADFDIDSIYTMQYNFKVNKQGKISKIQYYNTNEEAYQGRYGNTISLLERMDDIIAAEKLKEEAFTLTDSAVDKLLGDLFGTLDYTATELNDIFEEHGLSLELYEGLKKAVKNYPTKEEFAKITDINKFNTREARDNRILDIYIDILQDPANYVEIASPNTIYDTNESRKLAEGIYNPLAITSNFLSPTVQDIYRKKALAGRKLKGMSVNRDSFISVAQKIGLQLKNGYEYKFDTNVYELSKLKEIYGEENVSEDGTVRLTRFGNNATNTFTNIKGQLITSYVAQSTAHILDNVKFPLPYNVNDFTFNVWRVIPELGGTWDSATLLINQEAIAQIVKRNDNITSIHADKRSNAIVNAKNDLMRLYAYIRRNDKEFIKTINNKGLNNFIRKAKKQGSSAYMSKDTVEAIEEALVPSTPLSDEYLKKNLENYSKGLKGIDKANYLLEQINILNHYNTLNEIANQIGDFQSITSYDKARVGPTFAEIKDKMDIRSKVDNVRINTLDYTPEYNNLLVVPTEDGTIPYTDAIFEQEISAYPSIKAYYENGAKLANDIFANEFITESVEFRRLIQSTRKENRKSVIDYTIAKVLSTLPFFQDTDVNRLLGTNKLLEELDITEITKENLEKFENMSVANKLRLVKIHYKDYIDSNNILHHITTILDNNYDHQGINFIIDATNDNIIDSFRRMWYNKNPYYHLLAKDLVKYAYFVKGFTFGRNLSKVIPTEILYNEPTVIDEIEGVEITNGIGYSTHLTKQRDLHFENSTYIDYGVVHKINHARSNHNNRNIVPKVKHEKSQDFNGNWTTKPRHINWSNKNKDGIIVANDKIFSLTPKQRNASVVLHTTSKKVGKETVYIDNYYAKITVRHRPKDSRTDAKYSISTYYVPVNKLESYEFDSKSRNPEFNVHKPIEHYLNVISRIHQSDILAENSENTLGIDVYNEFDSEATQDELFSTVEENIPDENDDFINYNDSIIKHAQAITSDYSLRSRLFGNNELLENTVKQLKNINYEDNQTAGLIAALRIDADYAYKTIKAIEKRLYAKDGYINKKVLLETTTNNDARVEFTTFMHHAHSFLTGLERIKNLQKIKKDTLTKDEESLNKAIARLTELGNRVNELRATHKTIMNTYFENILTPISTNPEIKLGIRGLFDVQDDESKVQLLMDSLADTNNSFVANLIKQFIVDRELAYDDIKNRQESFDKQMKELNAISELPSIMDEDNKLIQEFNQKYKEDLRDHKQKLNEIEEEEGGIYNERYYKAEREYKKWLLDNMDSEESIALETAKFNANDILNKHIAARKAYDKIKQARRDILSNYDGITDYSLVSEEDTNRLAELERESKILSSNFDINGIKKTGEDLAIAKTIQKYKETYQKMFDVYYKPAAITKSFEQLLKKNKVLDTPEAKQWLAKNTKVKIKDNFWTEFEKHAKILGKEHTPSEIMDALKPYKDSDGTINGRAVPENLRKLIAENDRKKSADVEPRSPKAIKKPTNNEHYSTGYYDKFENKGYDSRDDHPLIKKLKEEINDILFNYVNDEGTLDTTSISLDDLKTIQELELKIKENSTEYTVDNIRDEFNEWLNKTHDTVIDNDKFNKADKIAKSKGDEYYNNWKKVNTQLTYTDEYYTALNDLRVKYGLAKTFTASEDADTSRSVTVTNLDTIRELYNVDSISDLPINIQQSIKKNKYFSLYDSTNIVYSLSEYLKSHNTTKVGKSGKIIKRKFDNIDNVVTYIKGLRKAQIAKEASRSAKRIGYRDALLAFHKTNTTDKYKALLEQHGEDSQWYMDNHIINHQGEIVPAHYWVIERPLDSTLYKEDAPRKSYWGYSKVTDKSYVDKAKTKARTWNNENITYTTTDYYDRTKKQMRMKSNEEYNKWYYENHYLNNYTNTYEPISIWTKMQPSQQYVDNYAPADHLLDWQVKDEHINKDYRSINGYALPKQTSKYKNKEYDKVKDKPLYKYIDGLMKDLTSHYKKDTIADEHQLPIMHKKADSDSNLTAKNILKKIGWYSYASREVTGENNDGVRILNMPYMNEFVEKELIEVPKEKEFENRIEYLKRYNEVVRQNKEIREFNKQFTKDHLDKDWIKVLRNFINASINHKFIYEKEHEMKLALEEIRNLDIAKRRNIIQRLRNITRTNAAKDQPALYKDDTGLATSKGVNSNLEQHFRSFMDMIFYGEFELDEGMWTKVARVLQNATSAKGMWLNIPGATNNVAYGKTQIALERFSGYYFNNEDRVKAEKLYWANVFSMMSETNSDTSNSLTNALIKKFDVVELQDEMAMSNNKYLDTSVRKHLLSTNSLYLLHHIGEHYMQNAAMLAMMHSNRLVNGKIQSFTEYTFDLRYNAIHETLGTEGKHKFDKFIRDNKNTDRYLDGKGDLIRDFVLSESTDIKQSFLTHLETLKTKAEKEFKSNPRLIDVYELKDGKASVKEGHNVSTKEFALFRRKVISTNQKIHGIYNKLDAGSMQKYALGRLAIQFKKWMRPGFIKRFGSRVGKSHWNESRNELDRGMYVSTFNFLTKPIFDGFKDMKGEENTVMEALGNIFKDYGNYISNIGVYWNTLNDSDKANIIRTGIEMLYFTGAATLMMILQGLASGDEDDKKWAYTLYAIDRLKTEILAYNPAYGFTNETRKLLRDPFAAMGFMDDVFKLIYTALFERDDYYKGGIYHGESKLRVQTMKNIPLINRRLRYENIQDYAGYYKLY